MSFTYNSSVVIMWTNTDTKRHYIRYNTTNTSMIVDTTSIFKYSSSSYWSKTSTTKMVKGTSYAGNYTNSSDSWQGKFDFTISATLTTTSKMWILSSTKNSITVKLQGWGFSGNAGSWPNVTIYCGTKYYTQSLSDWQSTGHTFTGLSSGTNYSISMYIATPDYLIDSTSYSTDEDTKGWYVYTSSGWKKATPYIYNGSKWVQCTPYLYSGGWITGS